MSKLVEEKVEGYEKFKTRISELEKIEPKQQVFVLFTGSKSDDDGRSWCPDCNDFENLFQSVKSKIDEMAGGSIFLRVLVGNRESWKSKESPFRTDVKLKLTSIPTLIHWNQPSKRLADNQILKEDNIFMVFED